MKTIEQPVVFLPGTLCDERIWVPLWQHMSFQQRSYVPLQWAGSLEQMIALTKDRIQGFNQQVHLVGYSMGGHIASICACESPANIASLTLIGYSPAGLSEKEMQQRKLLLKHLKHSSKMTMNKARLSQFVTDEELSNPNITQPIIDMEKDLGVAVLRDQIQATTPRQEMTSALAKMTFPIHYITARNDKIAEYQQVELASNACRNATHFTVEDTAHMMLLSQPQNIAKRLYDVVQKT